MSVAINNEPVGLPGRMTQTGYVLNHEMSSDEWLEFCYDVADQLFGVEQGSRLWPMGDVLRDGRSRYDDWEDGIAAFTPFLGRKAILKVVNIADKIDPSMRLSELPFWSFAPPASLENPEHRLYMIHHAVAGNWSRKKILQAVTAFKANPRLVAPPARVAKDSQYLNSVAEEIVYVAPEGRYRRALADLQGFVGHAQRLLPAWIGGAR